MKLIRFILGKIIAALDAVFSPKSMTHSKEQQARIDAATKHLVLYHMVGCPFCVKVRRHMKRLNVCFEMRDVVANPQFKQELIAGGGEYQAPCLRIKTADGKDQWMYESSDINLFLDRLVQEQNI